MKTLIMILLAILPLSIHSTELQIKNIQVMTIDSSINPATLDYIQQGYNNAEKLHYDLNLIKLNTPGGLVSTTKDIIKIIGSSSIPTVIWITPEGSSATSAGAIIASSAHLLYMSPGSNIGAATPIELSGDIKDKNTKSKAINDLVALVKGLSESRGRNAKYFEEMVSKASSFSTKDANEKKIINGICNNIDELKNISDNQKIDLQGLEVTLKMNNPAIHEFKMTAGQTLLNIFANPSMAYILFLIGAALIYLELQAPGGFIAGSIGTIFLILSGIGMQVLPLNFGSLGLLVLSFVLFILEGYVTSYGILSLAGIASMTFGSLFLFHTEDSFIELGRPLIFSSVASVGVFLLFIAFFILKDIKKKTGQQFNGLMGKEGVITKFIEKREDNYYYTIKVNGEIWKAYSKSYIDINKYCKVIQDTSGEFLEIEAIVHQNS